MPEAYLPLHSEKSVKILTYTVEIFLKAFARLVHLGGCRLTYKTVMP